MGRFLKIAVYIAVLFLGYLWIATVAKSCNKTSSNTDNTEILDDTAMSDEFEDDFFEDENSSEEENLDEMGGGSTTLEDDITSNPIDYTEVDEIIEESRPTSTSRKVTTTAPTVTRTSSSLNQNGKFLLLAGSYLIGDNAEVMVQKLKKLGYDNAEVVVFDMSQYHSVCAGRFNNLSSARQESSSLKRKGVDNYVHTKQ